MYCFEPWDLMYSCHRVLCDSCIGRRRWKPRETREGWPQLTVKTEANGDSKRTNERGPFLVGSLGLSCRYKRFFSALAALVGPIQKMFFLTVHYFKSFAPSPSKQGRQPCWAAFLLVYVSGGDWWSVDRVSLSGGGGRVREGWGKGEGRGREGGGWVREGVREGGGKGEGRGGKGEGRLR
jgi:hypothetical protein